MSVEIALAMTAVYGALAGAAVVWFIVGTFKDDPPSQGIPRRSKPLWMQRKGGGK